MDAPAPLPSASENGPEIGHGHQSFSDISCPQLATSSKRGSDSKNSQLLGSKQVGSICHQMPHCPGLESNQHDPKVTSPSSYNETEGKPKNAKEIEKPSEGGVPNMVSEKRESLQRLICICLEGAEILDAWPQLPKPTRSAILAIVRAAVGKVAE